MKIGDLVYVKRSGEKSLGLITKKLSEPRDTMYWVVQADGFQSWCHYRLLERVKNENR